MAGNRDRQALSGPIAERERRCPASLLPIDGPSPLCVNRNCTFITPDVAKPPLSLPFALRPLNSYGVYPCPPIPLSRAYRPLFPSNRSLGWYSPYVLLTELQAFQKSFKMACAWENPSQNSQYPCGQGTQGASIVYSAKLFAFLLRTEYGGVDKDSPMEPGCQLGQSPSRSWTGHVAAPCLSFLTY